VPSVVNGTGRAYLDAGGAAPLHPSAREALLAALDDGWADPRRLHTEGRRARMLLDGAREAVAASIGARTEEVSFAPSHALAVHAAVLGTLTGRRRTGRQVVASAVEHSAVLHAAGWRPVGGEPASDLVTVPVDRTGLVDVTALTAAVGSPGVALACLQAANGEVGTVQPVDQAHAAARACGVPLLVDAAAALGHTPLPPQWDLLTADAHGWGGPPGLGVLAVRAGVRWRSPWPEDDAELGRQPGGVPVPTALAAAVSLQAVLADRDAEAARRRVLVDRLRTLVAARVPDVEVVGDPVDRLPHVLTFSCLYVDGEALLLELDREGFAVGSGSACTASTLQPSHVLAAMGVLTHGNVRLALPAGTPPGQVEHDVARFGAVLPDVVARVRAMLGGEGL
jgi:cysteine desulfurase